MKLKENIVNKIDFSSILKLKNYPIELKEEIFTDWFELIMA